jgi:hypothetical protein
MAVQIDKKRVKETANVDLITPHGTEITVTPTRAQHLLARPALSFGDGVWRKYAPAGEDNVVSKGTQTGAKPPRKGTGENSGGE